MGMMNCFFSWILDSIDFKSVSGTAKLNLPSSIFRGLGVSLRSAEKLIIELQPNNLELADRYSSAMSVRCLRIAAWMLTPKYRIPWDTLSSSVSISNVHTLHLSMMGVSNHRELDLEITERFQSVGNIVISSLPRNGIAADYMLPIFQYGLSRPSHFPNAVNFHIELPPFKLSDEGTDDTALPGVFFAVAAVKSLVKERHHVGIDVERLSFNVLPPFPEEVDWFERHVIYFEVKAIEDEFAWANEKIQTNASYWPC